MKYLFFDIECSNCYDGRGKICEFGYVLTDENFNVIDKDNMRIAPGDKNDRQCRFDKNIYIRDPNFKYSIKEEEYFNYPKFPYYYEQIKKLFEDKELLVFAYSSTDDARYLGSEFERYNLKSFIHALYDVKIIKSYYFKNKEKPNRLINAFIDLCGENELQGLTYHLPRDDAFMTMRILQEIVNKHQTTVNKIIRECPNCFLLDANEYFKKRAEKQKRKKVRKRLEGKRKSLCERNKALLGEEKYVGRRCNVSSSIKQDENLFNKAIGYMRRMNWIQSSRMVESDIVIVADKEEEKRLKGELKNLFDGKFISLSKIE